MPDTRAYLYKIRHQTAWKNCKKSKSTFISEIIDNAKKPKGRLPGPPDYGIHTLPIRGRSTKRHLWDKQKRITVLEEVTKSEKIKRGPADYKPQKTIKVLGSYLLNEKKGQFMNETEFCSAQSPSPQKYDPNFLAKSASSRSPNANLNRDKSDRPACLPFKKTDGVSPFHYKDKDTKWKK